MVQLVPPIRHDQAYNMTFKQIIDKLLSIKNQWLIMNSQKATLSKIWANTEQGKGWKEELW